ncbi:hypothetical protein GCM10023166_04480 [Paeniglutamicibacter cryotolerans]|nr:hypothetical protein [Paeniglutamicibacter cryotolerans]
MNQAGSTREARAEVPAEELQQDDELIEETDGTDDLEPSDGSSGRWLDRFPEALDADPGPAAPMRTSALAYRLLFYLGMGVGVIASLALLASVFFQGWVATNFIQAGGDYLGSGPEAQAARDVLGIPLGGFVVALLAGFAALSVGAIGVLRGRR